jgi:hypothetical protein
MNFYRLDNPKYREIRNEPQTAPVLRRPRTEPSILSELVDVLAPHPGGLRRWSVMRAIRESRNRASRAMSLKFEDEVERVFRGSCSNCGDIKLNPETALFYKPEGKAGEVWAVHAERATAWVAESGAGGGLHEQ